MPVCRSKSAWPAIVFALVALLGLAYRPVLAVAQDDSATKPRVADATAPGGVAAPSSGAAVLPGPVTTPSRRIDEVRPQPLMLPNKDGEPVAVPGFTLDDFYKLYRGSLDAEKSPRPNYSIQSLSIAADSEKDQATLTIHLKVLLTGQDWVRVPLKLGKAVLRDSIKYSGPGKHIPDVADDGYVCWLRGEPMSMHTLTLSALVALPSGSERRLELDVPRAMTSEFAITVPAESVSSVAVDKGDAPVVTTLAERKQKISVLGLKGGDFKLSWRESDSGGSSAKPVLEASALVYAKIDGRSVSSEATLTVRSFGGRFDRFRVKLPASAQLVTNLQTGYSLRPLTEAGMVEVTLDRKTVGPVEIKLQTERAYDVAQAGASGLELAGFVVPEAVRQFGAISVGVVGDWSVRWGKRPASIRQVEDIPESLRRKDVIAGFEYQSQPTSLIVFLASRKTRVSVEPEYVYYVDADKVRLEARLRYNIRGGKLFSLDFELPEAGVDSAPWEIDEVGPAAIFGLDTLTNDGSLYTLSVPQGVSPLAGEVEIFVHAHRDLAADTEQVSWSLPRPRADAAGPAAVTVAPADNVELTPELDAKSGLSRQLVASRGRPADAQQEPFYFRGETPQAKFAAGFKVHEQAISVEQAGDIVVGPQTTRVEQRFTYHIAYAPTDRLTIEAPAAVAGSSNLDVSLDDQPLKGRSALEFRPSEPGNSTRLQVNLPRLRIGQCVLKLVYTVPSGKLVEGEASLAMPLAVASGVPVRSNQLRLAAEPGLRVATVKTPWNATDLPDGAVQASSSEPLAEVAFAVAADRQPRLGGAVVDRAWVQTWLTDSLRQDRVALRFTTSQNSFDLQLPAGLKSGEMQVTLDGKLLAIAPVQQRLVVPLEAADEPVEHFLELRYRFEGRPARGGMTLALPTFASDVWVRRAYWQLVLPRDEHLAIAPAGWTREFVWNWQDFFWARAPLLDQLQLESWVGAPHERALSDSANCYLLGGLGWEGEDAFRTAPRALIVFIASLVALCVGLVLIYVPICHHPAVLLAGSLVLAAVAILQAELALLALQAAALGIVLAIGAAVWRVLSLRPVRRVVPRGASSIIERESTELHYPPYTPPTASSMATATMALEGLPAESKS